MKHVLKVSRRLTASSEALTSAPVWISDTLLSETFERFSRGCRRHGSHVPGPLESRRRASKRKNTSIAYTGASTAPIDVTELFGARSQEWWRQPQYGRASKAEKAKAKAKQDRLELARGRQMDNIAPTTFSSWFAKPPPPPVPHSKDEESWHIRVLPPAQLESRIELFKKDVRNTRNIDEMRSLVRELEVDAVQKSKFLELALQHVLKSRWPSNTVKEFMLDPVLSPPGCATFRVLIDMLKRGILDLATQTELLEAICQSLSLGIGSPEDIKYMITSIPHFKVAEGAAFVNLGGTHDMHELYWRILSAIEDSKVLSLTDLGSTFVKTWVRDISEVSENIFTPTTALILWRLGCFLEEPGKGLASKILTKLVSNDHDANYFEFHEKSLLQFLEEIPVTVLPHALIQTTLALVAALRADLQRDSTPIQRWQDFLGRTPRNIVVRTFAGVSPSIWQEALRAPALSDERAKRALIACWVATSMSRDKRHVNTAKNLRRLNLKSLFQDIYPGTTLNGTRDVLARILETLQTLALPNTDLLLGNLRFMTDDYIEFRNTEFATQIVERDFLRHFAVLENDADYDRFRDHFNDALVDLAESVNKDLPQFLWIARTFAEKDEIVFKIVNRILKHNLAFHTALSRVRPEQESRARLDATALQSAEAQAFNNPVSYKVPRIEPRQALDFMNHLAVFYATSPILKPRQALRRVYWCFTVLHRYGAPIETPIIRALWHAGVTRYHQAERGAVSTVLKWIVKQVRLVEGDRVANMLLSSAGFRRKMEQQFDNLDWLHGDGPPTKIDGFQWLDPNNSPVELDVRMNPKIHKVTLGDEEKGRVDSYVPMEGPVKRQTCPKSTKIVGRGSGGMKPEAAMR